MEVAGLDRCGREGRGVQSACDAARLIHGARQGLSHPSGRRSLSQAERAGVHVVPKG